MIRALALGLFVLAPLAAVASERAPAFEHVHALAVDSGGRTLWLGAHTGLYRSEDGGRTWRKAALGTHHADIMAIAAHPADPAMLYVATHDDGVLKTTDGGRTWKPASAGLNGVDVHGIAVDPAAPDKLHAVVRDKGAGVYRTTDGGGTWVRVDDGPAGETKVLASVGIATGMGGIYLYAGTADGLQRSPDCF